jgi:hypothetical protein
MEVIKHRRNTIKSLMLTPSKYGVEIDLRSSGKEIIISHDPFKKGEKFSKWIKEYNHGTLIINLKEDGLEDEILLCLKKYKINSFFFLDQSFPSMINNMKKGINNYAVRVSEYESIETVFNFKDKVEWVWVDLFSEFPLNYKDFVNLKNSNFKLCLVSPELQKNNKLNINSIQSMLKEKKIFFDAVCTKFPEKWAKIF